MEVSKMDVIKKIDIHAHVTPNKDLIPPNMFTKYPLVDDADLLGFYDKLNIEKGVLLPLVSPEFHFFVCTSQEAKLMVDKHPDRFIWFCNIDPRNCGHDPKADLSKLLMFYKNLGAKGVGELTAQLPIDDPLMDNLFYHCAQCDMPVTIHVAPMNAPFGYYGIKDDVGLPRLEKMLKKHPKLKFIGHSQPFWAEMSADITEEFRNRYPKGKVTDGRIAKLLREYDNLYCDLSAGSGANAIMRDPEYAELFLNEFADRILYGCDICEAVSTFPYKFSDFLENMRENGTLKEENYRKICRENAEKILGLK
jgi:predicted TIM-barrel fold metal-dependent hydrolase